MKVKSRGGRPRLRDDVVPPPATNYTPPPRVPKPKQCTGLVVTPRAAVAAVVQCARVGVRDGLCPRCRAEPDRQAWLRAHVRLDGGPVQPAQPVPVQPAQPMQPVQQQKRAAEPAPRPKPQPQQAPQAPQAPPPTRLPRIVLAPVQLRPRPEIPKPTLRVVDGRIQVD